MKNTKDLGIWLDHANAYLTEFTAEPMHTTEIASTYTHEDKISSMSKSEFLSHNKEQHEQASFYKKIAEVIAKYDRVVLFGPTDAKLELHNVLKAIHHLDHIIITTKNSDKMTEHEQQLFVRNYFTLK
jgi:hypothetical protein